MIYWPVGRSHEAGNAEQASLDVHVIPIEATGGNTPEDQTL